VYAVYKDGVLQPLEPLPLEKMQPVTITITDSLAIAVNARFARKERNAKRKSPARVAISD
jgi:predicted DNA-binding antitoxin AbrB/MazE fold protein